MAVTLEQVSREELKDAGEYLCVSKNRYYTFLLSYNSRGGFLVDEQGFSFNLDNFSAFYEIPNWKKV